MGNPFKGDVAFKVDDAPYILSLRTNALCQIQSDFGAGFDPDGNRKYLLRISYAPNTFYDLRTVFFHALQEHHADTVKTREDAGNLMDRLGRKETIDAVRQALEWAFPPKQEGDGAGPKETPESSGTGAASS